MAVNPWESDIYGKNNGFLADSYGEKNEIWCILAY